MVQAHVGPQLLKQCSVCAAQAQMAESVDALVSNTSRFTPVPVRPRLWVHANSVNLLKINSLQSFPFSYPKDLVTFGRVLYIVMNSTPVPVKEFDVTSLNGHHSNIRSAVKQHIFNKNVLRVSNSPFFYFIRQKIKIFHIYVK